MVQLSPLLRAATAVIPLTVHNPGAATIASQAHTFIDSVWGIPQTITGAAGNKTILPNHSSEIDMVQVPGLQSSEKGNSTAALMRLRTFSRWGENWDGEGAPAPDAATLNCAAVLLGLLSTELGNAPKVMLNALGEPMFIVVEERFELAVTVKSKDEASFYVAQGNDEDGGLTPFDGVHLPPDLKSAIRARLSV